MFLRPRFVTSVYRYVSYCNTVVSMFYIHSRQTCHIEFEAGLLVASSLFRDLMFVISMEVSILAAHIVIAALDVCTL